MSTSSFSNTVDSHVRVLSIGDGDSAAGSWDAYRASMKANSVGCAILIGSPNMDESRSLRDLADAADEIAAVATWVDVTSEDVGAHLDDLMESPKMRSVALAVGQEPSNHWLLDDNTLRGLRLVAERGLRLDLEIEPRQLPSVGELAVALPELQIVIAHIGSPFIARSEREPWGVHMLNVAPHKNVYAKLSGLIALDVQPWSVAHQRLFVASMVRMLGYDRLMFGSDWPGHAEFAPYDQVRESTELAAGPMTDAQHERVFGGTARAFYGLS